jgi:hypothetical protein
MAVTSSSPSCCLLSSLLHHIVSSPQTLARTIPSCPSTLLCIPLPTVHLRHPRTCPASSLAACVCRPVTQCTLAAIFLDRDGSAGCLSARSTTRTFGFQPGRRHGPLSKMRHRTSTSVRDGIGEAARPHARLPRLDVRGFFDGGSDVLDFLLEAAAPRLGRPLSAPVAGESLSSLSSS